MEPSTATSPVALRPDRPTAMRSAETAGVIGRPAKPPKPGPSAPGADDWRALLGSESLTPAEVDALAAIVLTRELAQGDAVFTRAECATSLVALVEGVVALGLRTADGTLRTERIVRAPAWLDLGSAWLDGHHAMDACASTPAVVAELPIEALQALLARMPGLAQCFIRGLAAQVHALAVNTHELMHKDAPGRLAQWLVQRSEPAPEGEGQRVVRLEERKRDVASQLAITPETLSRLMRSFTRQGVIEVAGYTVRVIDPHALARLAQA